MKQIVITLDSPDIDALEKQGDKDAIAQVQDFGAKNIDIFIFLVVNV
jgi:hypothetical protein